MVRAQHIAFRTVLAALLAALPCFGDPPLPLPDILSSPPTTLGDCNLDFAVDMADAAQLAAGLYGPGLVALNAPGCCDIDRDGDADLADAALFQTAFTGVGVIRVAIAAEADDGTEVDGQTWYTDGLGSCNRIGAAAGIPYTAALRFHLPQVARGERFAFARLVLPATGYGEVTTAAVLRIAAIDQDSPVDFDEAPPARLPRTGVNVPWRLEADWPSAAGLFDCLPLWRYSPDVAPVINAVLARPDWGSGPAGKTIALVIEDNRSGGTNYLAFQDWRCVTNSLCPGVVAPQLELYRDTTAALVARELLGRPTSSGVTINAVALVPLEAFVEYQAAGSRQSVATPAALYAAGQPIEVSLSGLAANQAYSYRLRYRRPADEQYSMGPQRSFHTQRAPGAAFTFTVQSDSHAFYVRNDPEALALYRTALANVWADAPDFHIDLGDTFACAAGVLRRGGAGNLSGDVLDYEEALDRHLLQRPLLGVIAHSVPIFIVLGNHEGEQGWRLDGTLDNLAIWAARARTWLYPLPRPGGFYTGDTQLVPGVGFRENYYAWRWGDALFVVLDPFWYTRQAPHGQAGLPGSGDNWDWTLGRAQYDWLAATLADSTAPFKFVFIHHLTAGVDTYGRGGIEAASHALGGRGSFEWGGASKTGAFDFPVRRAGWALPVHDLLVQHGVNIVFHGHDHAFVYQELDGVVYQECPQIADPTYNWGCYIDGQYAHGAALPNSGHLRVHVEGRTVQVDYVRAFLSGRGPNGEVAYTYTVPVGR